MGSGLKPVVAGFQAVRRERQPAVLATVVETQGSTYRKAGARMLMVRDGRFFGLLGGGCFESDLLEQAHSVFESGVPREAVYDMRGPEDAIWGLGLGCNGAVHILLQLCSTENDYEPLRTLARLHQEGETAVLVAWLNSAGPGAPAAGTTRLLATTGGQLKDGRVTDGTELGLVQQVLETGRPLVDRERGIFYDPISVARRMLILGAGPDAVPLVRLAAELDWRVSVADHRPGYAEAAHFPEAHQVLLVEPGGLLQGLEPESWDAVVLMTHNVNQDAEYLRQLAAAGIPYIALLGPAARREYLLETLGTAADGLRERLYGPAGLDIGAESPEEIALAVMAECQAVHRRRSGGHLRQLAGPLHEP